MAEYPYGSFSEDEFLRSLNQKIFRSIIISAVNKDHILSLLLTEDELIDYHETKRIFKLYGINLQ